MRAVLTRVSEATVTVDGETVGAITSPERGVSVETGQFGAKMRVSSVSEGPFTVLVET